MPTAIFTEQVKPMEVEVCVAEVGATAEQDQLYRLTYDGSIGDEPNYVVMGGQAETISTKLKDEFTPGLELKDAIAVAIKVLLSADGKTLEQKQLEVAVLDRTRPQRAFRRIQGAALKALLPTPAPEQTDEPKADGPAYHLIVGGKSLGVFRVKDEPGRQVVTFRAPIQKGDLAPDALLDDGGYLAPVDDRGIVCHIGPISWSKVRSRPSA